MSRTFCLKWCTAGAVAAAAALIAATVTSGTAASAAPAAARTAPVPDSISASSTVTDVLRFAGSSGQRWRTLSASGHTRTAAGDRPFALWVAREGRSRAEHGSDVRVRRGAERARADRGTGAVKRFAIPSLAPGAQRALEARMAAHRAEDPTILRDDEVLVDTPVNDLISPARIVRTELGMTATSVSIAGTATIAGRETVVLEARFPAELAKEDHWDVYVDTRTGILMGLVIEPLDGSDRYESFVDAFEVDGVMPDSLFDCANPLDSAQ